jgi:hypothetical protein
MSQQWDTSETVKKFDKPQALPKNLEFHVHPLSLDKVFDALTTAQDSTRSSYPT